MNQNSQNKHLSGASIFVVGVILWVLGLMIDGTLGAFVLLAGFVIGLYGLGVGIRSMVITRKMAAQGKPKATSSKDKRLHVAIAVGVILVLSYIAYGAYVNDFCIKSADRNTLYARDGVPYSMVKDPDGEPMMSLTRYNYIKLCKEHSYRLPF